MGQTIDRCPRCARSFHCGFADAAPCACTTVRLDDAALAELRRRYRGCLCMRCLGELSAPGGEGLPQRHSAAAASRMEPSAPTGPLPEK